MIQITKTLYELLNDAGQSAKFRYSGKDKKITAITDDTRCVFKGCLFICIKGESFDGHSAAAQMLDKGAAAIVCDHDLGLGSDQIIVKDTREFYGLLSAAWFSHPERHLNIIGITGTNGKTTIATMIHHILTESGIKAGFIGTTGVLSGNTPLERDDSTPTTPKVFELYKFFCEMAMNHCTHVVMEVSSFALEQQRTGPAVFSAAVFTNLTQDHLDYHGTIENYFNAKKKLFDKCRLAFINTEDPYGKRLYDGCRCTKFSYGVNGNTAVYASRIKYSGDGVKFWFCVPGKSFPVSLKMMGSYNVSNAAAAMAVCLNAGVSIEHIISAAGSFKGVRGRCENIPTGRDFTILCDYAHTPDAIENMLSSIREQTKGRLICLFGCGGDRDRTKRPLMAKAAAKYADHLIITSDNPRNEDPDAIIADITAGLEGCDTGYECITDRRKAIFHAVKTARSGDVIVLAGKGHEDYQVLAGNIHIHFDEREICAEALRSLSQTDINIDTELSDGMSPEEICLCCGGRMENIDAARRGMNAGSICSDTRKLHPGCMFIAFRGENFDGHDFVEKAVKAGAVCAITERPITNCPCIIVPDTKKAILQIAGHYRSKFNIKLVGITGSTGKTTTKEMTALALSSEYSTLKTEGNLNNEIGAPFTLLRLSPKHKAAVIEMGMSAFGEIERISGAARPDVCVITNIGWSHAENLGSREGILKAKLEILSGASPDAPLIINGDDAMLRPLKDTIKDRPVITCSVSDRSCDCCAVNIEAGERSISFDIIYGGETVKVKLPCPGVHNALDAVMAFAAARTAGCDGKRIAQKLSEFRLDGLRQHIEERKKQTVLIDCYNASPDSMKAAIDVLCGISPAQGGKRAAVLGDMLELGSYSAALHEEVGQYAAQSGIDLIICYGSYAKFIAEKASKLGTECAAFDSREELLDFMRSSLKDGDAVLFKASRGMHMEEIIDEYYGKNSSPLFRKSL